MNRLYIYPTTRAIREAKAKSIAFNQFLPKMVTVGDFESRAVVARSAKFVNTLQRKLFLKEAVSFKEIEPILKDTSLVKFYTQADDFFSFFQEISAEGVALDELFMADTYAEFERDLNLLKVVLQNYKALLEKNGFTDRIFLPNEYKLNRAYIESFDSFYLELEGYLTNFELELFSKIAKICPFIIKLRTTPFNKKLQKSFANLGIKLEPNSIIELDLSKKKIISSRKVPIKIDSEVIECSESIEQIAVAFAKIDAMVQSGIEPDRIALIVPDESIIPLIRNFDRVRNFNFAMGVSFREHEAYRYLEQLYKFLKGDEVAKEFLKRVGFDFIKLLDTKQIDIEQFFEQLKKLEIPLFKEENLQEGLEKLNLLKRYFDFMHTMQGFSFSFKEWLFLWLYELKEHTLDDAHGGKVTVMGLLESRGVTFDGVVILDFNDDKVPAISGKDRFLNSAVRAHAKLPTRDDRENLQKHYYTRLLEQAKTSALIYVKSDTKQPSKFLFELGLHQNIKRYQIPNELLFKSAKSSYNPYSHLNDIEFALDATKTSWSSSKLKTFLECKRKFYYRYIAQIKEPKSDTINDGQLLHTILQRAIKPGVSYSNARELEEAIAKELGKIEYSDTSLLYKKPLWQKLMAPFVQSQIEHFKSGWQVKRCEFTLKGKIGGLEFSGRVDRMDIRDDRFLVIDYKSGAIEEAIKKNVDKLEDFQLSIYAMLVDRQDKSDFAYLEILKEGKMTLLEQLQERQEKLLEHIEYLKSHKSFVAERTDNLQKCRYCPYQLLCHRGEYL